MKHLRKLWPWALLVVVGLSLAAFRFWVVESPPIIALCQRTAPPAGCAALHWILLGFLNEVYGYAALAGCVLCLVWRHPFSAWLASALGLLALNLYCCEAGALAFLIGSLRLLRLQSERAAPAQPYRQGQRQIQPQP